MKDPRPGVAHGAGCSDERPDRGRVQLLPPRIYEKEKAILENRPANRKSILLLFEVSEIRLGPREVLAAGVAVRGAVEFIRACLRHRVNEKAAEVALPHVERRQKNLVLLHCVKGNRLGVRLRARLAGGAEAEEIT